MKVKLTLEERRKLLHEYHWPADKFPNKKYVRGVGIESECDFYNIPTDREENIVEFGKRIFDDYYSNKISLKKLIDIIDNHGAMGNDMAVLLCYCEKDLKVTYQIHKLEQHKEAKISLEYFKGESPFIKSTAMCVMTMVENIGVALDKHFNCDKFAKMIIREHQKVWGDDYPKLLEAIEEKVKKLNFPSWNYNFNKYFKK